MTMTRTDIQAQLMALLSIAVLFVAVSTDGRSAVFHLRFCCRS